MHRDYFMLLDRSSRQNSRRLNTRTPGGATGGRMRRNSDGNRTLNENENVNANVNGNVNELHSLSMDALNSGYFKRFFTTVKKLGSGSYGTVFLTNHILHGILLGTFAVKVIAIGDEMSRLIEILKEVRALQMLHHRNVIDYKHSWLENYQPAITGPLVPCLFILMEYADMGNVMDYVMPEYGDDDNETDANIELKNKILKRKLAKQQRKLGKNEKNINKVEIRNGKRWLSEACCFVFCLRDF